MSVIKTYLLILLLGMSVGVHADPDGCLDSKEIQSQIQRGIGADWTVRGEVVTLRRPAADVLLRNTRHPNQKVVDHMVIFAITGPQGKVNAFAATMNAKGCNILGSGAQMPDDDTGVSGVTHTLKDILRAAGLRDA